MIREVRPEDAEALAGVQHRAWHRAYADYVDPERFGTLAERVTRWREIVAQPPALGRTTLVYDLDGRVAGFASMGSAREEDLGVEVGELMALHVDPPAQGAGVGGLLLDAAVARLRDMGFAAAVLRVFVANEHARHVYAQRGWVLEPDSERADPWAPEVRYRRAL